MIAGFDQAGVKGSQPVVGGLFIAVGDQAGVTASSTVVLADK